MHRNYSPSLPAPRRRAVLALVAITLAVSTPALAKAFEPASFAEKRGLPGVLDAGLSAKSRVDMLLRCTARVTDRGEIRNTHCLHVSEEERRVATAIYRAAERSRMDPARVDGNAIAVWVQFAVRIENQDLDVRMHHFWNVEQYGPDYTGPQVVSLGRLWRNCVGSGPLFISFLLDATGAAQRAVVVRGEPDQKCQRSIEEDYAAARIIPALKDGSGVPARFLYLVMD